MIVRGPRPQNNFYLLDKEISEDSRLSWAARGLLIFLLGKPDHWQVSPSALVNETQSSGKPTGRDGVYSLLSELRDAGYLTRIQARAADGSMGQVSYLVSESPLTEKPETVKPDTANPTQVSIDKKQGLKRSRGACEKKQKIGFDGKAFTCISDEQMHLWTQGHPGVAVPTELIRAACWIIANPARAKSNYAAFLDNWLNSASQRLSMQRAVGASPSVKHTAHKNAAAASVIFGESEQPRGDFIDV